MDKSEFKITYYRGQGPGGQHRNKTANACKIEHIPTGIVKTCDSRSRQESLRGAMKAIELAVKEHKNSIKAKAKKADRDYKIHNTRTIRTYDFKKQTVKDHRTGKTANLKKVLGGDLDAIRGNND